MNLEERRESWEIGHEVNMVLPSERVVLVILKNEKSGLYSLHRYFKLCQSWEVSVDVQNKDISECLKKVSKLHSHLYPKG